MHLSLRTNFHKKWRITSTNSLNETLQTSPANELFFQHNASVWEEQKRFKTWCIHLREIELFFLDIFGNLQTLDDIWSFQHCLRCITSVLHWTYDATWVAKWSVKFSLDFTWYAKWLYFLSSTNKLQDAKRHFFEHFFKHTFLNFIKRRGAFAGLSLKRLFVETKSVLVDQL